MDTRTQQHQATTDFHVMELDGKPACTGMLEALGYATDWDRVTLPEARLVLATLHSGDQVREALATACPEEFPHLATRWTYNPADTAHTFFDADACAAEVFAYRAKRATEGKRPTPFANFVTDALARVDAVSNGGSVAAAAAIAPTITARMAAPKAPSALKPASPPAAEPSDAAAQLTAALMAAMGAAAPKATPVDADEVRALVAEGVEETRDALARYAGQVLDLREEVAALARAGGRALTLEVKTETTTHKLEGEHFHPLFPKVLALVAAGLNVMLVGPAGSGKTHIAEQVARALGRQFGSLSFTAGASEAQLTGWLLPTGESGRFEYAPSQFVRLFEGGESLFLFDEMDRGDANMLMIANSALANGYLNVPQRRDAPTVKRGAGAGVIAACNTYGTGMDYVYASANVLDGATLDRFYVLHMDYDAAFEAAIAGVAHQAAPLWQGTTAEPAADCALLHAWVSDLRTKVTTSKLNRVISTRMLQKGMTARRAGVPLAEVCRDLLSGWTRDELAKVGR